MRKDIETALDRLKWEIKHKTGAEPNLYITAYNPDGRTRHKIAELTDNGGEYIIPSVETIW